MFSTRSTWTRRAWLTAATPTSALIALLPGRRWRDGPSFRRHGGATVRETPTPEAILPADPKQLQTLAQRAVEAARAAGARYADARLTRIVVHRYWVGSSSSIGIGHSSSSFGYETEMVGLGVRALTAGAWGFSATPLWLGDPTAWDGVVKIAQDAVAQSKATAGASPPIELAPAPVVQGSWQTPIKIDPFTVSIEEKTATLESWGVLASEHKIAIDGGEINWMTFAREERVLATSEGTLLQQTFFETDGHVRLVPVVGLFEQNLVWWLVDGLTPTAKGWELLDDIDLPRQFASLHEQYPEEKRLRENIRTGTMGRNTIVCDGATMASILHGTLGVATQLDRCLGYDANGEGASFVTDPLSDVGNLHVGSELVTVTCDRSAPSQLGTAKWDDEGVVPESFAVVQRGVLTDFQTTREQATWLAPYYQRLGRSTQSHGCAGAESALFLTTQHMPNVALQAGAASVRVNELLADVKDGVFVERATLQQTDFNGRTGLVCSGGPLDISFRMRQITNGRLGHRIGGLGFIFDTIDFWKHVTAIGGASTQGVVGYSGYDPIWTLGGMAPLGISKGIPVQAACQSTQAVAAVIQNQPLINAQRRM